LKRERASLQALAEQMTASGEQQIVEGEPDAALMGHGPTEAGYNVQTAIDAKHKLIVHHEVVRDANDRRQLYPMASATKEVLATESLVVLADAGYHNAEQAQRCEDDGITPAVPAQRTRNQHESHFPKEMFVYDREADVYRCPAGAVMEPRTSGVETRKRQYATRACGTCELRMQCTTSSRRRITRTIDEDAAARADQRAREPGVRSKRSALAEHPFAWLKRTLAYRFLSRGADNVKAEVALSITAFNMLRAINTIGAASLLQALRS
jgi:transposase